MVLSKHAFVWWQCVEDGSCVSLVSFLVKWSEEVGKGMGDWEETHPQWEQDYNTANDCLSHLRVRYTSFLNVVVVLKSFIDPDPLSVYLCDVCVVWCLGVHWAAGGVRAPVPPSGL